MMTRINTTMIFSHDSLTDWLQVGFTIAAGIFALILFRQSNREKRNIYVADILNRFYSDNDIRTIIYAVDSGNNVEEIKFGGQLEQSADKTIQYFNYLGYLIKDGALRSKDIRPFNYQIKRVLGNRTVQKYIKWVQTIDVPLDYLDNIKEATL